MALFLVLAALVAFVGSLVDVVRHRRSGPAGVARHLARSPWAIGFGLVILAALVLDRTTAGALVFLLGLVALATGGLGLLASIVPPVPFTWRTPAALLVAGVALFIAGGVLLASNTPPTPRLTGGSTVPVAQASAPTPMVASTAAPLPTRTPPPAPPATPTAQPQATATPRPTATPDARATAAAVSAAQAASGLADKQAWLRAMVDSLNQLAGQPVVLEALSPNRFLTIWLRTAGMDTSTAKYLCQTMGRAYVNRYGEHVFVDVYGPAGTSDKLTECSVSP